MPAKKGMILTIEMDGYRWLIWPAFKRVLFVSDYGQSAELTTDEMIAAIEKEIARRQAESEEQ